MLSVQFMSLTGKFTKVREATFANEKLALAAVEAHAASGGYTGVKEVTDDDPTSVRYTAKTPGGRGGRNVAFADVLDPWDFGARAGLGELTPEDAAIVSRNVVSVDHVAERRDFGSMVDRERHGHSVYLGANPADWWLRGHGRVFA